MKTVLLVYFNCPIPNVRGLLRIEGSDSIQAASFLNRPLYLNTEPVRITPFDAEYEFANSKTPMTLVIPYHQITHIIKGELK